MSGMDTFGWSWRSELGRDEMLRDELVAVEQRASSRMRSQLTQIQGSMERRIAALSAAFDAYVELGDVREQLMEFGDSRTIRRDAMAAIEAMAAGAVPAPLDPGRYDTSYWLLDATNAVIAVAADERDREHEQRISAQHPGVATFLVACAMALGHGARVGDLVRAALIGDGRFNRYQQAIATGVVDGLCGPDGMTQLAAAVEPTLPRTDWAGWLTERAGSPADEARLTWLDGFLSAEPASPKAAPSLAPAPIAPVPGPATDSPPAPTSPTDPRTELQALVSVLVAEGSSDEAALIRRAAELRRRVEDPTATPDRRTDDPDDDSDPGGTVAVVDWLTSIAVDPARASAGATIRGWFRPHLAAVVQAMPERPQRAPLEATVRHRGWSVPVSAEGVDRMQVAAQRRTIGIGEQAWTAPAIATIAFGVVLAGLGVLTIVSALVPGLVVVGVGVAVIAAGVVVRISHGRRLADARRQRSADLDEAERLAAQRIESELTARADADTDYVSTRRRVLERLGDGPV